MPRTGRITKRQPLPDPIYKSRLLAKIINRSMRSGKKSVAQKQIYQALELLKNQGIEHPLKALRQALDNIKPQMEVRARRIGGAAYQVPVPVKGNRRESLAIRWLVEFANQRPNKEYHTFAEKLAAEIKDASNNEGLAIKKRDNTHRMAEANKAFAHFRW
jgi:small subunit ribosomal protein S7